MDQTANKDIQFLRPIEIVKESINVLKSYPKTFILLTLALILPLSLAILVHYIYFEPLLNLIPITSQPHQWLEFIIIQFFYIAILFIFSLLSTAAVVFTFASIYTSKPVSFISTLSTIPRIFKRLFITFLFASLLMIVYNAVFLFCLIAFISSLDANDSTVLYISFFDLFFLFEIHVYVTAMWHLASVVSVLEPVYGWAAMKRSKELLEGNIRLATALVIVYLVICAAIGGVFRSLVIPGEIDYGLVFRSLMGGFLVVVLVILNFIGLSAQCIIYYVCKSYHREEIDKGALHDQLDCYLGAYVPLQSSVEMGM
ncbi:hypothetical protein IFM89_037441 [Coptis chinensis]|uniref:Uncharacterized protein n=1 Tax=Coptis chinensis TaxID=261450 RepID=A0A835HSW6_9MAGN|nr:hypothetical protein IFM89_037441 [Coptis chinensis]